MNSNLYKEDSSETVKIELSNCNLNTFLSDYIKFHGLETAVKDISGRLYITILDLEQEEREEEREGE